jgi:transcriptional regulator with XRE-family HTH domain
VETLAQYVTRIMKGRGLNPRDVEARSGKTIADAYVTKIMKGTATNPSILKLKSLAVGLGVDEDEVFKVARRLPIKAKATVGEPWPAPVLIKAMDRIVSSPEITKAVKHLLTLAPEKLKRLLKIIEREVGR